MFGCIDMRVNCFRRGIGCSGVKSYSVCSVFDKSVENLICFVKVVKSLGLFSNFFSF